jgi:hypothetical protein
MEISGFRVDTGFDRSLQSVKHALSMEVAELVREAEKCSLISIQWLFVAFLAVIEADLEPALSL